MPTSSNHGIEYEDFHSGYRASFILDGSMCVRPCLVDWDDHLEFIEDMLGWSKNRSDSIHRSLPDRHPFYDWMYASEAELAQGIGATAVDESADDLIRFVDKPGSEDSGKCIVNITYKALDYDIKTDEEVEASTQLEMIRYVTRKRTYATEALPIPNNFLKWVSDGQVINQTWTKQTYTMELSHTWHQVPSIPETNIATCIGKVNDSTYFDGYSAETLLFVSPDIQRTRTAAGDIAYEITYKFIYRPNGWNKLFRASPAPPDYATVIGIDGTTKLYTTVDMTKLFRVLP